MRKSLCTTGLCLILSACAGTNEDYVAVPKVELEALQACLATADTRAFFSSQQDHLLLTLTALRESTDRQTAMLGQQWDYVDRLGQLQCIAGDPPPASETNVTQDAPPQRLIISDKLVIGEIETVLLPELNMSFLARVDTGAATSSLDARNIQNFERNGDEWVRFTIVDSASGDEVEVERRRVRRVRIIHSTEDEGEIRPVVEMRITLGELTQVAEFTLTSRNHLEQPILIGRNILRDVMLVDVSRRHMVPVVIAPDNTADPDRIDTDEDDDEERPVTSGGDNP